MDKERCATLTRTLSRLPSRRGILYSIAGSAFGFVATRLPAAAGKRKRRRRRKKRKSNRDALGCLNEGALCKPSEPRACCSGSCERRGDKSRCGPLPPDAFGCTTSAKNDFCATAESETCPGRGGFCIVDDNDRPLCIANTSCKDCTTDADCTPIFGATARCIQSCARCLALGTSSICVSPDLT